jgi:hypothetical protein
MSSMEGRAPASWCRRGREEESHRLAGVGDGATDGDGGGGAEADCAAGANGDASRGRETPFVTSGTELRTCMRATTC